MTELVFHLSGVVRERGAQVDFTGPLALILQLLSRNKIEARDISVSLILDQYLAWLDEMAAMDLDIASEFVAMASHLAYIKTKTLLGEEKPEELEELITSLEKLRATDVYLQIKGLTEKFADLYLTGAGLIPKPPELFEIDPTYRYSHGKDELLRAMAAILDRGTSSEAIARAARNVYPRPQAYPIADKLAEILSRVRARGRVELGRLFHECQSKSETVAAFIAVLELCAEGSVSLSEDGAHLTVNSLGNA